MLEIYILSKIIYISKYLIYLKCKQLLKPKNKVVRYN